MAKVGELFIALSANTTALTKDLKRSTKISQKSAQDMERAFKIVGAALLAIGTAAVVGLGALIKSSIDTADKMGKMAQSVGLSVESLSGLAFAAELSDINLDELGARLTNLNRRAKEGARGVKSYRQAFDALGITLTDSQDSLRTTEELLLDIADRFSKMEDGTIKAALATDIFSNAGVKMIPFLNQGREGIKAITEAAERMGLVISTETAAAAENFNDSLTILRGAAKGLAFELTKNLLPALADLTGGFAKLTSQKGFLETLRFIFIETVMGRDAFAQLAMAGFLAREEFRALGKTLDTFVPSIDLSGKTAKKSAIEISFMARAIRGVGDAHEFFAKKLKDAIDRQNEELEAFAKAPQVFANAAEEAKFLLNALGEIPAKIQGVGAAFDAIPPKLELMRDVGQEFSDGLAFGFSNLIARGGTLSDVFKRLTADLAAMLARLAILRVIGGIFGGLFGGGGSAATAIAGGGGGAFRGFQHGGTIRAGQVGVVGEGGEPELIAAGVTSSITPISKLGGVTIINKFDLRGASPGVGAEFRRQLRLAAKEMKALTKAEIAEASLRTA